MTLYQCDIPSAYIGYRLLARLLDALLIALFVLIWSRLFSPHTSPPPNLFGLYLLYNLLVAVAKGNTLGRFAFQLKIAANRSKETSVPLLISREIAFFALLPLICASLLGFPHRLLHDRICNTRIIKEES